jgi:Protein of unknown function (DUF2934)
MPGNGGGTDAEVLHGRVQERAYATWEIEDGPYGLDLNHWLQAEAEIRTASETASHVTTPSPTASPASRKVRTDSPSG